MHERLERGFTIVELMIAVAIVAVLAVVVIPSFMKESTRGKAKSEVSPMFAELGTREEQYKLENNAYLATAACPASANAQGTDVVTTPCSSWTTLRVQPSSGKLTCSYVIRTGAAGVAPNADTEWPVWLTDPTVAVTPAVSWYFIKATCPSNEYFTASWDTKIRSQDGK